MKFRIAGSLALLFAVAAPAAHAYEVDTHAQITKRAIERSVFSVPNNFLNRLELDSRANLLGEIYFDSRDGIAVPRERYDHFDVKK